MNQYNYQVDPQFIETIYSDSENEDEMIGIPTDQEVDNKMKEKTKTEMIEQTLKFVSNSTQKLGGVRRKQFGGQRRFSSKHDNNNHRSIQTANNGVEAFDSEFHFLDQPFMGYIRDNAIGSKSHPQLYFIKCCTDGNFLAVRQILQDTAHPISLLDWVNHLGSSALHHIAKLGKETFLSVHIDIVETLIEYGANVDIMDVLGWTPLCYAANSENPILVSILLQHGANIDIKLTRTGTRRPLVTISTPEEVQIFSECIRPMTLLERCHIGLNSSILHKFQELSTVFVNAELGDDGSITCVRVRSEVTLGMFEVRLHQIASREKACKPLFDSPILENLVMITDAIQSHTLGETIDCIDCRNLEEGLGLKNGVYLFEAIYRNNAFIRGVSNEWEIKK